MIILGLIFGFLGSVLLVFACGPPLWKRPHWHEKWRPRMISIGFTTLSVGFFIQIIGSLSSWIGGVNANRTYAHR